MATTSRKPKAGSKPGKSTVHKSPPPAEFSKEDELAAYYDMLLITRFEIVVHSMYTAQVNVRLPP